MMPIIDLITRGDGEGGNLLAWNCEGNGDGVVVMEESENFKEHK